jgi:TRAP-type C4-dicarboxylate transport system permease small subunit
MIKIIDRSILKISRLFNYIGVCVILVMMFFTASDVLLRYIFNAPIEGAYEAIELMMAISFCFGIAYTQRQKGHVSVDLLVQRLNERKKAGLKFIVSLISFFLCLLITWQSFLKANVTFLSKEYTYGGIGPFGHVPIFPFVYLTSSACLIFTLELFVDLIASLKEVMKK